LNGGVMGGENYQFKMRRRGADLRTENGALGSQAAGIFEGFGGCYRNPMGFGRFFLPPFLSPLRLSVEPQKTAQNLLRVIGRENVYEIASIWK